MRLPESPVAMGLKLPFSVPLNTPRTRLLICRFSNMPLNGWLNTKIIILRSYRLIERPEADAVRTVCVPFQNPYKMWRIGPDGLMVPLGTELGVPLEPYNQPRQALPEVYWQTGYVDAAWTDTILTKKSMTGEAILPLVIDSSEWVDIDSPDDWRRAERLIESGEITSEDLGFSIQVTG